MKSEHTDRQLFPLRRTNPFTAEEMDALRVRARGCAEGGIPAIEALQGVTRPIVAETMRASGRYEELSDSDYRSAFNALIIFSEMRAVSKTWSVSDILLGGAIGKGIDAAAAAIQNGQDKDIRHVSIEHATRSFMCPWEEFIKEELSAPSATLNLVGDIFAEEYGCS